MDNSNNENKDDIFVCCDSIQYETPFEKQEIPKSIVTIFQNWQIQKQKHAPKLKNQF